MQDPPDAVWVRMDERIYFIYTKIDMLCEEEADHENRIDSLERTRDRQTGICAAAGGFAAVIVAVVAWLTNLLKMG